MGDVDYRTEETVREAAVEFRRTHDALDWSASIDDLIELHGYEQDQYSTHSGIGGSLQSAIARIGKKVKALVSVKDHVILLARDVPAAKHPFSKAHELGHAALDWHREILYVCDEHDLSPSTRQQMEFEANTFASELLLPAQLLQPFYDKFETSMETVLLIKERAKTSIEMTVYAYVRHHPGICGVAVLEDVTDDAGEVTGVKLTRKSLSRKAVRSKIGRLSNDQVFERRHTLYERAQVLRQATTAEIYIGKSDQGDNVCKASIFNNGYKTFCLLTLRGK